MTKPLPSHDEFCRPLRLQTYRAMALAGAVVRIEQVNVSHVVTDKGIAAIEVKWEAGDYAHTLRGTFLSVESSIGKYGIEKVGHEFAHGLFRERANCLKVDCPWLNAETLEFVWGKEDDKRRILTTSQA